MRRDREQAGVDRRGSSAPATAAARPSLKSDSDREAAIVAAAQAGDPVAVEELLAMLGPSLLRAVRALMGPSHPDLEDVVQDVLIAVVDALPSFRGDCSLLHFAIRIATRRTTTARRRSRSVLGWLEAFWRKQEPLEPGAPSPGEETLADRRRVLLRALLGEIPEAQAEALALRVALGHSIDEVAVITRAPINTVRSRLRLAKDALRTRIAADPRWAELWEWKP
jgi:RNA polymerase sigma-70 factor (ECF subfamily)